MRFLNSAVLSMPLTCSVPSHSQNTSVLLCFTCWSRGFSFCMSYHILESPARTDKVFLFMALLYSCGELDNCVPKKLMMRKDITARHSLYEVEGFNQERCNWVGFRRPGGVWSATQFPKVSWELGLAWSGIHKDCIKCMRKDITASWVQKVEQFLMHHLGPAIEL